MTHVLNKSGEVKVITTAAAGGWPFTGKVVTVDSTDADADFATLALALADGGTVAGDTILLSSETHAVPNATLTDGVHLVGQGIDATILQTSTTQFCLQVGDASLMMNLSVKSTYAAAAAYAIYMHTTTDTSRFINVKAEVDPSAGAFNSLAWYVGGDSELVDCIGITNSGGFGYAFNGAGSGDKRITNGYFDGSGSSGGDDINNQAGTTTLINPVLENGNVDTLLGASGSRGWYFEADGDRVSVGSLLDLDGMADGLVLDADGDTTISSPIDDQIDFEAGNADRMTLTSAGLALAVGTRVNEFSTDGALVGNSNNAIPTEQAVKTYVDREAHARAYRNASGIVCANGAWTTITYNIEEYDTGADLVHTTGIFTAPVTGHYMFAAHVQFDTAAWNAGSYCALTLYKNGVVTQEAELNRTFVPAVTSSVGVGGATILKLTAGNTIRARVLQTSGANKTTKNGKHNVWFAMSHLVD